MPRVKDAEPRPRTRYRVMVDGVEVGNYLHLPSATLHCRRELGAESTLFLPDTTHRIYRIRHLKAVDEQNKTVALIEEYEVGA
ncbi:MAG: hypothetical protein WCK39_03865 [Methanomassiliicoccales archaeon]